MSKKKKNTGNPGLPLPVIILLVIGIITFIGTAFFYITDDEVAVVEYPKPTEYFFIEDYSKVLNETTESYIYEEAVALYEKTKAQVVVVTVPDTYEDIFYDFSIKLANDWGIGDAELDNGILILFLTDPSDPHVRMEVGKGLEGAVTDGIAGRILDEYAVEAKDAGLWNKAAANTFTATLGYIYPEYGLDIPDTLIISDNWHDGEEETEGTFADAYFPEMYYVENKASFTERLEDAFINFLALVFIILILGVCIVIAGVLWLFGSAFLGGGGGGSSGGGGSGGGFSGGGGSFGGGGASR